MLRVQHDAGQQRLRLLPQQIGGLHQILQELRHQLTGGGGIGFVEAEGGVFDVAGRPAVVVDHRHPIAGLQQLGALHHVGAVGVHHNDQSARPHFQKCLRPGGERPRILRQRLELGQNRSGGVVLQINDHLGPLAVLAGNAVEPRLGAYGVHVRKAVAHDIDPMERVGHTSPTLISRMASRMENFSSTKWS